MEADMTKSCFVNIEFDVKMTCKSCVHAVQEALKKIKGIESFNVDLSKQSVVVKTNLPAHFVLETLESTGRKAVLKGFGSDKEGSSETVAAVAEIRGTNGELGVVRFHQINKDTCIIDGTIDGLTEGEHGLHIHEYGDLSNGFKCVGDHFNPTKSSHGGPDDVERHYGDLGNVRADGTGRANFRREDVVIKVWDIIGRSLGLTSDRDDLGYGSNDATKHDGNSGNLLACAVIARSAGLFQNPKRLCPCDGISIWDENKQVSNQEKAGAKL